MPKYQAAHAIGASGLDLEIIHFTRPFRVVEHYKAMFDPCFITIQDREWLPRLLVF